EVEDVGVLLLKDPVTAFKGTRVLRTKRRLHVQRRRGNVREHDNRRPLRDRHPSGELTDRECNRSATYVFSLGDGLADLRQTRLRGHEVAVIVCATPVA